LTNSAIHGNFIININIFHDFLSAASVRLHGSISGKIQLKQDIEIDILVTGFLVCHGLECAEEEW
jgi:hypothetical protein